MLSVEVPKRQVALLMLTGFLLMGCTGEVVHPAYIETPESSPNPMVPSFSPSLTFTPETPIPTPGPQPWTGPLLYPTWLLDLDQSGFPLYDLGTGQIRWIETDAHVREILAWSPDGCEVAYRTRNEGLSEDQVRVINIGTGKDSLLFTIPGWPKGATRMKWSPTGEWIAYNTFGLPSREGLYLMQPDRGETRALVPQREAILMGWLESGREVIYKTLSPTRLDPNAEGEAWEGVRQLIVVDIFSGERTAVAQYTTPLESWEQLIITNVHTLRPLRLSGLTKPQEVHFVDLYWTSDLNYFLLLTAKGGDEALLDVNLYILDVQHSQVRRIGFEGFKLNGFVFQSQDSSSVAFVAQHFDRWSETRPRTYVVKLGTGEASAIGGDLVLWKPVWSPDNTMLSFSQPSYGNAGLEYGSYIYDLTTDQILARLPDLFFDPSPVWSGWTVDWAPRLRYGPGACTKEP